MGETENRSTVERLYAAMGAKDMEAILALVTDDVAWSVAGPPEIPWAGPLEGREGIAEFVKRLGGALEVEHLALDGTFADGDRVVTLGHQSGNARQSGKPYAIDFVHVWTLQDGRIQRLRVYYDTAHMVDALRSDGG